MLDILDGYNVEICTPPPFTGGTANTRGDKDGTMASTKMFDVIGGDVKVIVYGKVLVAGVGAGTLEVGVAGNSALLIAQCTDATTMAAGDYYVDASVAEVGGFAITSLPTAAIISSAILEKSAGTDITAGNIRYTCLWKAITPGAFVKAVYPNAA